MFFDIQPSYLKYISWNLFLDDAQNFWIIEKFQAGRMAAIFLNIENAW